MRSLVRGTSVVARWPAQQGATMLRASGGPSQPLCSPADVLCFQNRRGTASMNRTPLWLTVFAAGIAASVFAQVSPQYRNWEDSALRYLMMTQEKTDWASLKTDAEAKAFIELFWARRDPTPETPDNELRQQIETRIAEADKRCG